jgi:hypothetical protein
MKHAKTFSRADESEIGLQATSPAAHRASSSILISSINDGFGVDSPARSRHIVALVAAMIVATRE